MRVGVGVSSAPVAVGLAVGIAGVEVAVGTGDVSPGNVSAGSNENLYVDNTNDAYNTEMDGFTVTMTLKMSVNAGEVNSIRIGIADVADSSYDSTLLIAGNSVQTSLIANDDTVNVVPGGSKTFDALANDSGPGNSTLTITHINGIEVSAGDSVTLTTGQVVTLNADGTFTVVADNDEPNARFAPSAKLARDGLLEVSVSGIAKKLGLGA